MGLDRQRGESFEAAQEWTRQEPLNPEAWSKLAHRLELRHEFDPAAEAAKKALSLRPGYPPFLFKLGLCQFRGGLLAEAAFSFEGCVASSLDLKDDFYLDSARIAASFCLDKAGDRSRAIALASQAGESTRVWLGKSVGARDILDRGRV